MARLIARLATLSTLVGAAVLAGLVLMICTSIAGRALAPLGLGPVRGDFELTEALAAFAVFCFLPLAQLRGSHATVDVLAWRLSARANRMLRALWEVVFLIVLAVILWRLSVGMRDKLLSGETSYLIGFPVWWAYAACLLPAAIAVMVAMWSAAHHIARARDGRDTAQPDGTADR
jgi:TRAP-type C4-dicarboxylate transport system permease small subunit